MGYRYRHWTKYCLPLAVLFCLILPSLRGVTLASDDSGDAVDKRLHYIVRYWHADGTHEDEGGAEGKYLEEGDPPVTIHAEREAKKGETFAGFATAAGHDAVDRDSSTVTISYQEDIHLVKVHAFYKDTNLEKEGSEKLGDVQTQVKKDGTKVYNTSIEGLHTDKTATTIGDSGRDFELELESWFVGDNKADVGMVLDASGSMAFTSNDLEPIKMTDEQVRKYGRMQYISQEDVDKILTKQYTDNSKLAYSGYTYFVYDASDPDKDNTDDDAAEEFVPIGYWNGEVKEDTPLYYPESDKLTGYYPFNFYDKKVYNEVASLVDKTDTEEINYDISNQLWVNIMKEPPDEDGLITKVERTLSLANAKDAYNRSSRALDLVEVFKQKSAATVLDISPQKNLFTISFAIKGSDSKPVVWIGDKDQTTKEKQAWYAIYADTKRGMTKVSSGLEVTTKNHDIINDAENIENVEGKFTATDEWTVFTYVFEDDDENPKKTKVTIYVEGKQVQTDSIDKIDIANKEEPLILLGGSAWAHDYGGDNWEGDSNAQFLLDELYFYECALTKSQVEQHYEKMQESTSGDEVYAAVAPSDPNKTIARLNNADTTGDGKGAGWYLVSSDSDWKQITSTKIGLLTGKRYNGIPEKEVIYNEIKDSPPNSQIDPDKGNTPDYIYTGDDEFKGNQGDSAAIKKDADVNWNGSIIFYIDSQDYLRCFYNSGKAQKRGDEDSRPLNIEEDTWEVNDSHCSYVYQKKDDQRVKTEALQRSLGAFVTQLSEVSKDSQVSAVRFSTDNIDSGELVMLDWTKDTMESTGMLGLRRGEERTAIASSKSESDKDQYNYVLTGGTATRTGLKSYIENLDDKVKEDAKNKSLIIFTDGKDTTKNDGGWDETKELARQLKEEKGYTIYCVMLQSAGKPKEEAIAFLNDLASIDESSHEPYVFQAEDVETLTEIFTRKILDRIINNLPGYTVQDYIDPRFDLVDADDNVIYLKADGNILIDKKSIKLDSKGYDISICEKTDNDVEGTVGKTATLYYDNERDMYYLQWQEQTIPGCSTGADRLNVWKSRIHIRAKEDFIGGNALVSNGNTDGMNMVFHPDEQNPSSGTDDTECQVDDKTGKITHYPSRGFPRTTVNVERLKLTLKDGYDKIYMGQSLSPSEALEELSAKVKDPLYYEYLERYMNWIFETGGTDNQNLIEQLASGEKIELPYYYLPDAENSNQAGNVQPDDQIGLLTYQWQECDSKGVPKKDAVYIPYETTDTRSRYYQLSISYEPMSVKQRGKENKELIRDSGMEELKEPVGSLQEELRGLGTHQTDIVRGELVIEARVLLSDLTYLAGKNGGKLDQKESFLITRSYNGKENSFPMETVFAYTSDSLKTMQADSDGYVSIFSEPSQPLPIGRYTVRTENKAPFPFGGIGTVTIADHNGHFSQEYTSAGNESKYAAPAMQDKENNVVSFYLGVPAGESASGVNLDAQLGHAIVTYKELGILAEPTATVSPLPKSDTDQSEDPDDPKDSSNTRLGDKLPAGRTDADDKPDTGDHTKILSFVIIMIVSIGILIPVSWRRYHRKRMK